VVATAALPALLVALSALGQARPEGSDAGLAPPLQLTVRAVPDKAKLGEPFVIELSVTHLPAQRYELKAPGELGDFEYLGQERTRTDGPTSSTTTIKVSLAAFSLGKLKTPALTLELTEPGGSTELESAGTEVEVVSSLPPEAAEKGANLFDVLPPEELPVRTWRVLQVLAALLVVGALAWAGSRWLRNRRLSAALQPPPVRPLDTRTVEALDALAALDLPAQGRAREFYFRLSEIVRGYLGERYAFEALECTTPELLEALRIRRTPGLALSDLATFATQSDLVRYAKTEPAPDDCRLHLELGYRMVHETTVAAGLVIPEPPAATPGSAPDGPG
jgi:hypothetical protein